MRVVLLRLAGVQIYSILWLRLDETEKEKEPKRRVKDKHGQGPKMVV